VIGFVDNDIIVKLAALDLFDDALKALGVTYGEVFVLSTAKYKLGVAKNPAKAKARYGEVVFERIAVFVNQVQEVETAPSVEDQTLLADIPGIDPGEAILISAASQIPASLLATGDKRALGALVAAPKCAPVIARLEGRFICLEQIVLRTITLLGFQVVLDRVLPGIECDNALRAVFGSGRLAQEPGVRAALKSYVDDLRGKSGALLTVE
jgi:hypothetical protein